MAIDLPDIHHLHNEPGRHVVKSDDVDFLEEWKEPLFWMVLPFFLHWQQPSLKLDRNTTHIYQFRFYVNIIVKLRK